MRLHDDLSLRAHEAAGEMPWVPSPMPGVERRMLFRIGEEKARATSVVRYASGSRFARHDHPGGEEILVMDGVFQDETGDFPAGSYIRNPPGTGHAPGSAAGCTIFVKLWQFSAADHQRVVRLPGEGEAAALREGAISSRLLFKGASERVAIEEWAADALVVLENLQGLELLVLEGSIESEGDVLGVLGWLRVPAGEPLCIRAGPNGAAVWFKAGPLLHRDVCAFGTDSFDPVI